MIFRYDFDPFRCEGSHSILTTYWSPLHAWLKSRMCQFNEMSWRNNVGYNSIVLSNSIVCYFTINCKVTTCLMKLWFCGMRIICVRIQVTWLFIGCNKMVYFANFVCVLCKIAICCLLIKWCYFFTIFDDFCGLHVCTVGTGCDSTGFDSRLEQFRKRTFSILNSLL